MNEDQIRQMLVDFLKKEQCCKRGVGIDFLARQIMSRVGDALSDLYAERLRHAMIGDFVDRYHSHDMDEY